MFLFHRNWRPTVMMRTSIENGLTLNCSKNNFQDLETFHGSLNNKNVYTNTKQNSNKAQHLGLLKCIIILLYIYI